MSAGKIISCWDLMEEAAKTMISQSQELVNEHLKVIRNLNMIIERCEKTKSLEEQIREKDKQIQDLKNNEG